MLLCQRRDSDFSFSLILISPRFRIRPFDDDKNEYDDSVYVVKVSDERKNDEK